MSFLKKGNEAFVSKNYQLAKECYLKARESMPQLGNIIEFNLSLCDERICSALDIDKFKEKNYYSVKKNALNREGIEYYQKDHRAAPYLMSYQVYSVDIVIPVYNALEDVKRCLQSVAENRGFYRGTTYIINDASDKDTTEYLRWFTANNSSFSLIEHEKNCGYTKTVNDGLKASTADYVITLNSDTIVTKGWLQGLVRCIRSGKNIGIVGPLSNAASWQNVPSLLDENNQFAVNELPQGFTPDDMAQVVQKCSHHIYPRVPFVNGFCFMIAREVIEKVGFLDEETFPTGYGEENDYCLRALEAGFELAIADDTYVFHAKSKSFGHEKRKVYSKNGSENLKAKHGKDKVNSLANQIREMRALDHIRERVASALKISDNTKLLTDPFGKKILFLLPVSGGGGGVHSIVQETMGMRRLGISAKIAVPKKHRHKFIAKYEDIDVVEDLFLGFENHELIELSRGFDVIIGTIFTSMKMVKEVVSKNGNILPAYYIQDYEPLFFDPGTAEWVEARDSYTLVPGAVLFAKTDWICQKVFDEHGIEVKKVAPSVDHEVYKPDPKAKQDAGLERKFVISAMIRPKTPRRGAERTMRVLNAISEVLGDDVHVELFGCEDNDPLFLRLERGFKFVNNGELTRLGVARVLQKSDCFIDLSDYQAFGRTGIEAMACGAFPVITKFGGTDEYAVDGINSIVVDPLDEEGCAKRIIEVATSPNNVRRLKNESLYTASKYSIHNACVSEQRALSAHFFSEF